MVQHMIYKRNEKSKNLSSNRNFLYRLKLFPLTLNICIGLAFVRTILERVMPSALCNILSLICCKHSHIFIYCVCEMVHGEFS